MNPFRSIVMFAVARCPLQSSAALTARGIWRGAVGGYNQRPRCPRSAQIFSLAPQQHLLASRDTSSAINRRQLIGRQAYRRASHRRASTNGCNHDQRNEGLLQSSTSLLLGNILPFVGKAAMSVGTIGVGILALLYFKQGSLLYIPTIDVIGRDNSQNPPGYRSPSEYGIPFETHLIPSVDGVAVHSWLLLHPQSKERQLPTIIFFHGNAGNIGVRIPNAVELFKLDANVLLVEYRGYGESEPEHVKPTESGIKADAEAVLDFILDHPHLEPSKVFMFCRSLGGAVAFHVADYAERTKKPLAGIIVENTFESIGHMVDILFPFLSPFKDVLLRNKWDSTALAGKLSVPVLYISGDSDEIVPSEQMKDLYRKSKESSRLPRLHSVKGGTHNETWLQGGKDYWLAIKHFMQDAPNKNVQ